MTPNLGWLTTLKSIPRGVWTLGLVSLFMDISSEMIHALLPLHLVTVLGPGVVHRIPGHASPDARTEA
jgi:hypothetical protein